MPREIILGTSATPDASRLADGQWATWVPVDASRPISALSKVHAVGQNSSGAKQAHFFQYTAFLAPRSAITIFTSSRFSAQWVCIIAPRSRAISPTFRSSASEHDTANLGVKAH